MNFETFNRIQVLNANADIDADFGPYVSVAAACAAVPAREKGKTVGIVEGTSVIDYHWKNGTANVDLVPKGNSFINSSTLEFSGTGTSSTAVVKLNSITPNHLQPISSGNFLMRKTAGTGNPESVNTSDVKELLGINNKQVKSKVIYIGSDTILSSIHDGKILVVTAYVTLTIPSGLLDTFTSCVIDIKAGQCTIATAVGVTATGYYSLILGTGDKTSIYKEDEANNNFRII